MLAVATVAEGVCGGRVGGRQFTEKRLSTRCSPCFCPLYLFNHELTEAIKEP